MVYIGTTDDEVTAIREIKGATDRAAAIVAAAMVENRLEGAMKFRFELDDKLEGEMFRSSAPLGSFSAKIKLGFMLRLYSRDAYNDLVRLKDIRNDFAHNFSITDFNNQSIQDRCKNFVLVDDCVLQRGTAEPGPPKRGVAIYIQDRDNVLATPRGRYIHTAMVFMNYFFSPGPLGGPPRL